MQAELSEIEMSERRRIPRKTLCEILNWMQFEADTNYMGDLQNNILPIFSRLPASDKRTFLRAGLEELWEKEIQISNGQIFSKIQVSPEIDVDLSQIEAERFGITVNSKISRERNSSKLKRIFFILASAFLGMIAVVTISYLVDSPNGAEILKKTWFLFRELF